MSKHLYYISKLLYYLVIYRPARAQLGGLPRNATILLYYCISIRLCDCAARAQPGGLPHPRLAAGAGRRKRTDPGPDASRWVVA